jgi:nitrate/nitrite-specific signal transduction histidine kinase
MNHFLSSLRFRLLLLVLLALLPSVGLVIYTASEQRQLAAIKAQENAARLVRAEARSQEQLIGEAQQLLMVLAQIPAVRDRVPTACTEILATLLKNNPRYTSFSVIERDGTTGCYAVPSTGTPPSVPAVLQGVMEQALETRNLAVSGYGIGPSSGRRVLGFAYPILDEAGQSQAVVTTMLDVVSLNELAAQSLLPPGSTLTANDRTGTILARYPDPEKWVGQSVPDAPIFQTILGHRGEGTTLTSGEDGVMRLYAFTPLQGVPGKDIYVSVGIPIAVAFAEADQILTRNLIALGLVAALTLGAAWISSDLFVLRQVRDLLGVTGRLADGDLSARTGLRHGTEELDQLAHAFDQMGEALEQREIEHNQMEEQARRRSTQSEALMHAVAEAMGHPMEVSRIAETVLSRTLSGMDLVAGCVFLKRGEDFVLIAHNGFPEAIVQATQRLRSGEEITSEITKSAHSDVVRNISAAAFSNALVSGEKGGADWIGVPIKSKGRTLGVMCLANRDDRSLDSHEQDLLTAVGQQIGVAIENAELYEQVQIIGTLKERERLSRELHDGLAQVLGYLCVRNKVAADLIASREVAHAEAQLQEIQVVMQEAYQDVRESILGLRMTVSPNRGLIPTLKEYAHRFGQQTGIRVNLVYNSDVRIGYAPDVEVQLLRIIQEALTNARKHSEAKQAWIRFEPQAESVVVTIEDDGRGFDPALVNQDSQQNFGLQTMRERAEGVGGAVQVSSQPGQGTKIAATLPCNRGGE